jgi:hypothetical protein
MKKTLSPIVPLIFSVAAMAAAAGVAPTVLAQAPSPADGGTMRPPPGPPPEVLEACGGKAAGAACSFSTPRGDTLTGTCSTPPPPPPDAPARTDDASAEVLACDVPGFHRHHPPPS